MADNTTLLPPPSTAFFHPQWEAELQHTEMHVVSLLQRLQLLQIKLETRPETVRAPEPACNAYHNAAMTLLERGYLSTPISPYFFCLLFSVFLLLSDVTNIVIVYIARDDACQAPPSTAMCITHSIAKALAGQEGALTLWAELAGAVWLSSQLTILAAAETRLW
jgi:hypothetical protein